MDSEQELTVLTEVLERWDSTGGPVSEGEIARATGFDGETVQRALRTLDAKGYFGAAVRGDDKIGAVAAPTEAARLAASR